MNAHQKHALTWFAVGMLFIGLFSLGVADQLPQWIIYLLFILIGICGYRFGHNMFKYFWSKRK